VKEEEKIGREEGRIRKSNRRSEYNQSILHACMKIL
jgi:hypothetical protein